MPEDSTDQTVTVIGIADDRFEVLSPEAKAALEGARVVVGGRRHLGLLEQWTKAEADRERHPPETLEITADTDELMGRIHTALATDGGPLCVLASGDPGFFGILRTLLGHLDRDQLRVLPAPSSVAIAFARLNLPWDDAVVVSAHGRPLEDAVRVARTAEKVAVLTSPDSPPERLGAALLDAGCRADLVAVCSRLGSSDEEIQVLTLPELAASEFDALSVVVIVGPGRLPLTGWSDAGSVDEPTRHRVLAWGRDESFYGHRDGMITKAETRSVILGKLALPDKGVLWDVGAGSGSVAIECALFSPGLTIFAIERNPDDAERITSNAARAGVGVHVVVGDAPDALETLPAPDRVFVGGGGIGVLERVLGRLAPRGHIVASFASIDRAAAAARLLGHLVQVRADRGEQLEDGSWRLVANNPVFVVWGPSDDSVPEP